MLIIYFCLFVFFSIIRQCGKGKLYAQFVALATWTQPADLPVSTGPSEEVQSDPIKLFE